jgi:hypothetical protein
MAKLLQFIFFLFYQHVIILIINKVKKIKTIKIKTIMYTHTITFIFFNYIIFQIRKKKQLMGLISICHVAQQMITITPNFRFKCGYNQIRGLVEIVEKLCAV